MVAGQSALLAHASPARSPQVAHWHLRLVHNGEPPAAVQKGLDALSVADFVPVVLFRLIDRSAIIAPESMRQSRLVVPSTEFGDEPFASQFALLSIPPLQVPPLTPSFGVGSLRHREHGWSVVLPVYTIDSLSAVPVLAPVAESAVPTRALANMFWTHVPT